ncbi:unnamed protein product [Miscanthus lutarioriparius]|uniref:Glycosyltransferase n=1 Tax=Miscanthus lutarioriparius TaxID=422564 RepID=A0A811N7H1_9POAL|nr:unnamed protein product [Miscanthus lutarioriparius]
MEMESAAVAIVTVPFPAQGHLNQLLHLSLLLAARGLPVHFVAPEPHLQEARARLHGWDGTHPAAVRFRALDVPAHESPAPDPRSPFPAHMQPLFEAYCAGARAPLAALLAELAATHRRVVVLHDRMAAFAVAEAARLPSAEALGVHCLAASYNVGWADREHALLRRHGLVFHPPDACATPEFGIPSSNGQRLFAVGPLSPVLLPLPGAGVGAGSGTGSGSSRRHECLDWLDAQPPWSVLYVSFGTTSSLRPEQVRELAAALRDSGTRFVWVLRDADRADLRGGGEEGDAAAETLRAAAASELGPDGPAAGVVVTGWAPQLEILAHGATAAFMSHCGWNSTVESLSHGKPILAWPMHSDQPWDAELVCKYLRAGVLVRPWERRHDVTPTNAIRDAIDRVLTRRKAGRSGAGRPRSERPSAAPWPRALDELVAYYVTR